MSIHIRSDRRYSGGNQPLEIPALTFGDEELPPGPWAQFLQKLNFTNSRQADIPATKMLDILNNSLSCKATAKISQHLGLQPSIKQSTSGNQISRRIMSMVAILRTEISEYLAAVEKVKDVIETMGKTMSEICPAGSAAEREQIFRDAGTLSPENSANVQECRTRKGNIVRMTQEIVRLSEAQLAKEEETQARKKPRQPRPNRNY
ncbi:hypothetical protein N7493_007273 [Penicillium malachiteum]|uniref:Uncharacterized protein n=1 Tax=Penicillium malachiteum TaxID=1324776 RepID=A0AAD6MUP3_9EURO|nr:hypothetical protein N7493_007273 [Penicillium malachiteum]